MQPRMTNYELAQTFNLIANLLQIKGEVIYKILAYQKAAESLTNLGRDINDVWKSGGIKALQEIPGIGKAIAEKIDELLTTGELGFLNRLENEIPPSLAELLEVPDLGPKKVKVFWETLGIKTLAGLEAAARAGQLQGLPGMGAKSEAKIIAGIESLARRTGRTPLGDAWPLAQEQLTLLRAVPGVKAAEAAGSLRRMRETVGDIDILVAADDSDPVMQAFTTQPAVVRVLGQGSTKASVEYANGMRAQVWVHPPERFGTALQYATGSKDHNVRMRELALSQGLSLSEHALIQVNNGQQFTFETEESLYQYLGIPWVPPELREDRGEVTAAKQGNLPVLIQQIDMVSQLHNHSTWSDGRDTIKGMAVAARNRGYKVVAITDHSYGLGIVQGVTADDLFRQKEEIYAVQHELGDSIRILHGIEMEIRADGTLDLPDDVLEELDIVIGALHVSLRQPREQVTQRMLNAIHNPHVDIIAHPTGRIIPDREGADLDMDRILMAAAEYDVALEINANPKRLDLNDIYARRAVEMGIKLSINTDAHDPDQYDLIGFGLATARRGWVYPDLVINTWEPNRLLTWLNKRG